MTQQRHRDAGVGGPGLAALTENLGKKGNWAVI
jgi:hypothetical protein